MARREVAAAFDQALADNFGFLTTSEGFFGPELQPGVAFYYSPNISVEVALDPREGAVITLLAGQVSEHHFRAELSCLYAAARVGPVQDVRRTARTTHSLEKSMSSQAIALRALLPLMRGPNRDELLRTCHGR